MGAVLWCGHAGLVGAEPWEHRGLSSPQHSTGNTGNAVAALELQGWEPPHTRRQPAVPAGLFTFVPFATAKAENISHNLCLLLSAEESSFIFTVTSHFEKAPSCLCPVCPCSGRGIPCAQRLGDGTQEKLRWKSLLIHSANGSGRKALCVLMAEYQPMYHTAKVIAFFFFFQLRLPTLPELLS